LLGETTYIDPLLKRSHTFRNLLLGSLFTGVRLSSFRYPRWASYIDA